MMNFFRTRWPAVVVTVSLIVISGGCSQRKIDDAELSKTDSEASGDKKKDDRPNRPEPVKRTGLTGNWVLDISNYDQRGNKPPVAFYTPVALLNISKNEAGKYVLRVVEMPPKVPLKLTKYRFLDNRLALQFGTDKRPKIIQAQLEISGAKLQGQAMLGKLPRPARFYPTTETKLARFASPLYHPNLEEYQKAYAHFRSGAPEALAAFVEKHPENPLSFYATLELHPLKLLAAQADQDLGKVPRPTDEELHAHLARLSKVMPHLGKQANQISRFMLVQQLLAFRLAPKTAKELIGELQKTDAQLVPGVSNKKLLAAWDAAAQRELDAQTVLSSKNENDRNNARKNLDAIQKSPLSRQPYYLYALATAAQKAGDKKEALELFARLLVLPEMEQDLANDLTMRQLAVPDLRKTVESLWKETHSDPTGLENYLSEVYQKNIVRYLKNFRPHDDQTEKARTVLCELITGTDARASSALELAVDGLARTFPRSELVVLRYFLSLPKPSPLACPDAQQRSASTYEVHQPMELRINGMTNRETYPGTMATYYPDVWYWRPGSRYFIEHQFVPELAYQFLRLQVAAQLERDVPRFNLRVAASGSGDTLKFTVNVQPADVALKNMRLHLVLAEDHLQYTGENRIRRHDMVVRSVVSGPNGIPLEKDKRDYEAAVDLAKLRAELAKNAKTSTKRKALETDLRNLHIVAFVQNMETKEIYDVTSAVVRGSASQLADRHLFGPVEADKPAPHAPPPALPVWPLSKQPVKQ